jgi:hypothetical protein
MNIRTFLSLLITLLVVGKSATSRAAGISEAEKAKIEALLAVIAGLPDAEFVRNGKTYDAKTAATFLRRKWGANEDDIATATDFISKAATGSGTTGKPYLIKKKDGTEVKCGEFLTAELKKLEEKKAEEKK